MPLINQRFCDFLTSAEFQSRLEAGDIRGGAIVFLQDTNQIFRKGLGDAAHPDKYYDCKTPEDAEKLAAILLDGDGTKYLADDGVYKELPDQATVLEISSDVMDLTSDSPSETIIAVFNTAAEFNSIVDSVRDVDTIVSGIFVDSDTETGKVPASIRVNDTAYEMTLEFINNGTLSRLVLTNTDGTMACVRNDWPITSGDSGSIGFIDGSLLQDQKVLTEEEYNTVAEALSKDITILTSAGDDFVLVSMRSINSSALNFHSYYVGISYEIISVSVTIDSSDKIVHITNSSIELKRNGDGTKFLADDGTYKTIETDNSYPFNYKSYYNGTISQEDYEALEAAVLANRPIVYLQDTEGAVSAEPYCTFNVTIENWTEDPTIRLRAISPGNAMILSDTRLLEIVIKKNGYTVEQITKPITLEEEGDGKQFLTNTYTYKAIDPTTDVTFPTIPAYTPDPETDPDGTAPITANDSLQTVVAKLAYQVQQLKLQLDNFKAAVQPDGKSIVYVDNQ